MLWVAVVSLLMAATLAVTAYLQAEAAWWKGPLSAVGLILCGVFLITYLLSYDSFDSAHPAAFIPLSLWVCGICVGLGAIASLILRRWLSPSKIAKLAFWVTFILSFLTMVIGSLVENSA